MSAPAAAHQELLVAQSTLQEIRRIIAAAGWADVHVRGHIRYLWVVVGSRLKNYCDQLKVSRAEGPFAHAIAMRHVLAYKDPARIDDDTVHRTCTRDAPELAREIDSALAALS